MNGMRCRCLGFAGLLAGTALGAAVPAPALAQTSGPSARLPQDIVITARRRGEALEKAGAAISALSGEELTQSGVNETQGLDDRFPALTVQPTASGNLIFIRGVGNFTLMPNSDPAVAFAYDGVFIGRPTGTMSQFFDLDRIELLKGPQGVLYGRNASAGSINVEPRQPVIGETSAIAHLTAATYSEERAEAAVNLALGNNSALRLSGAMNTRDHWLAGYRDGSEQHSGRAQLKTRIGERATVRLSADYNRLAGTGVGSTYVGNYVFVPAEGRYRFIESGLPLSEGLYTPESQAFRQTIFLGSAGRNLDAIASRPRQDHRFHGAHARVDAELGFGDLVVIPAWRRADFDGTMASAPFGFHQREKDLQTSVEARLSGRAGSAEWLAGAFLFDERIESDMATNLSSALALSQQTYELWSRALFGHVTAHLSRGLRLSGGLRWTRDRKAYESEAQNYAIACQRRMNNRPSCPAVPLFPLASDAAGVPFPLPGQPGGRVPILVDGADSGAIATFGARSDSGRLIDKAVTWRAGAEADLGPRTLLYATAETGYRPGGFNNAVGFETYEPERIAAYTLGLRHRGWGGRLRLDLEAFHWDYRDQQVSSLRPDLSTPPRNANTTENIGNSRIRGVEADLRIQPWRDAQIGAIVQHLDARYRSFDYVQANTGIKPLTGCDLALNAATNLYTVDCSAKQPYNSPRWALVLNGRQTIAVGDATLTAAADTHYRSSRNIGFAFLPEQRVDASWTSNAQLIIGLPGKRFEVAAFVRNIEGDRVSQFMIFHPVSNAMIAVTSPPRQWGLRTSLRF